MDRFGLAYPYTGSGAVNVTIGLPNSNFTLTFHLSAAPVTSEAFKVTLDAVQGAAYDTVLYNINNTTPTVIQDIYITDTFALFCPGDNLVITYPNTDGRTWGLRVVSWKV